MREVEIISHAKINLTLEVSARRADGYHEIDSVAQVIDLSDRLRIAKADAGVIEVNVDSPGVPVGHGNLVYRACNAFFDVTGLGAGARCVIEKRVPMQAGLGGGSANAAAAIAGLNRLYECGLPDEGLARIAARIGSDVPLFIYGGTVRMHGRGEIIEPLPDAPDLHMVVVKPEVGVSTLWAYAELDKLSNPETRRASDDARQAILNGDSKRLVRLLWNDFEQVVLDALDETREAKRMLEEHGAENTLLAGSGSAVFGVFRSQEDAAPAAFALSKRFARVFVTKSLTRAESRLLQ